MLEPYLEHTPSVHADAFVHRSAVVIGKVTIGARSSIWPCTTLRGDDGTITIGEETSVQDGSVVHLTGGLSHTVVGDRVTVGHNVILHGCTVQNDVLVGMGAIVLDNVIIGEWSVIGAGTLITAGTVIPPRSLVLGSPGKRVREVNEREMNMIRAGVAVYVQKAREYAQTAKTLGA